MIGAARRVAAIAAGVAALGALGVVTRLPYAAAGGGEAAVRLSWRWRAAPVEACRRVPPEELARRPVHMRRAVVCGRRMVSYRLRVAVDGVPVVDERVEPRGLLGDRPLSVHREVRVRPGVRWLGVSFVPETGDARLPAPSRLDTVVVVAPRGVVLVTVERAVRGRSALRVRPGPG